MDQGLQLQKEELARCVREVGRWYHSSSLCCLLRNASPHCPFSNPLSSRNCGLFLREICSLDFDNMNFFKNTVSGGGG